ncbi:MAG: LON peptidase substrate-binding domain-containing protein, partial [Clostridia bacterium]|nr:LON peptidase substrate-binding domain-containing protein [Clostridia bacterium]
MPYRIETVETETDKKLLNTIALRGIIIFPGTVASFEIARKTSVNALKQCELDGTSVFLVPQYDASVIEPSENDLMKVGVIARIVHSTRIKDGGFQVVVEGITRADRGKTFITEENILCEANERRLRRLPTYTQERIASKRLYEVFSDYLQYVSKPSEEIIAEARKIRDTSALADFLANNFLVNFSERKEILEEYDPVKRINRLCEIFQKDIEIINLEGNIQQKVRYNLSKQQREMYLREQMRAIRSELGDDGREEDMEDADEYYRAIEEAKLPKDVHDKLCAENA